MGIEITRDRLLARVKFKPTLAQKPILEDETRICLIAGGERAGKSRLASIKALPRLFQGDLFWLVGKEYAQTRAEWNYIVEDLTKLHVLEYASKNIDPGEIRYMGGKRIITKPTSDPRKIATEAPDGIILCEAAQIEFESYLRLRGRLAEKRAWMILSGTFENCLTADTIVPTDRGLLPINQVLAGDTINGITGNAIVSNAWKIGKKPVVDVSFNKGFAITGTLDHKVVTHKPDGSIVWEELDKIKHEDLVAIRAGVNLWGKYHLEPDDAYFLGLYIAEGCMDNEGKGYRTTMTNADKEIIDFLLSWNFKPAQKPHYRRNDKAFYNWLKSIGATPGLRSRNKIVPDTIMKADRETVCYFLRGLFDGDGSATKGVVYYSASKKLAQQVQSLLLNLGIVSSLTKRTCWLGKKKFPNYTLWISSPKMFCESVKFGLPRKQIKAEKQEGHARFHNQASAGRYFMEYLVCWCRVTNKNYREEDVYDITVPNSHAFCANGLIVHNSVGFYPEIFTRWQAHNEEEAKSFSLPTWTNTVIFRGGRQDPEILALERDTPHDKFLERYGGIPCPPSNKAIPEFANSIHVGHYKYNSDYPVEIAVDPGYAGAHAVLFIQKWGQQVVIVDEIYAQSLTTKEMIDVAKQKPFWAAVDGGTIDIAGKQHQAMEAPVEVWLSEAKVYLRSQKVGIEDGLEVLRSFLKVNPVDNKPKLLVDSSCKGFISECGGCQSPVGGGMWMRHKDSGKLLDKDNHSAKACIYNLVDNFGFTQKAGRLPDIKLYAPERQRTFVRT